MAQQQFFAGSMGPFLYEDTQQYADGTFREGFYGKSAKLINDPVDPEHAVNKRYVDAKVDYTVQPLIIKGPGIPGHLFQIKVNAAGVLYTVDLGDAPG